MILNRNSKTKVWLFHKLFYLLVLAESGSSHLCWLFYKNWTNGNVKQIFKVLLLFVICH